MVLELEVLESRWTLLSCPCLLWVAGLRRGALLAAAAGCVFGLFVAAGAQGYALRVTLGRVNVFLPRAVAL